MTKLSTAHKFDALMLRWMMSFVRKNYWRVAGLMDPEDLLQEAYLVHTKCRNKYRHVVDKKQFQALFMTAFSRHVHSLSHKRSRSPTTVSYDGVSNQSGVSWLERIGGMEDHLGALIVALREMPAELQSQILKAISSGRSGARPSVSLLKYLSP